VFRHGERYYVGRHGQQSGKQLCSPVRSTWVRQSGPINRGAAKDHCCETTRKTAQERTPRGALGQMMSRARAYGTGSEPGARSSVRDRRAVDPFDLVKITQRAEHLLRDKKLSPNHFVCSRQHIGRNRQPDLLGG
jgi:hypothetical protein